MFPAMEVEGSEERNLHLNSQVLLMLLFFLMSNKLYSTKSTYYQTIEL